MEVRFNRLDLNFSQRGKKGVTGIGGGLARSDAMHCKGAVSRLSPDLPKTDLVSAA